MNTFTPYSHQQSQQKVSVWDKLQHYGGVFLDVTQTEQQHKAAQEICRFLNSANAPSIEELSTCGVVSAIVQCLIRTSCALLQFQLLSALYAISTLTEEHRLLIRQARLVPQLVAMLNVKEYESHETESEHFPKLLTPGYKGNPSKKQKILPEYSPTMHLGLFNYAHRDNITTIRSALLTDKHQLLAFLDSDNTQEVLLKTQKDLREQRRDQIFVIKFVIS
uniref:Armadillo repeat-containing domain-containing protein n=1 Tax=Glossina pallidipes TaxID=7398 RepID=A0A1A9Z9U4_GLOPL